MHNTKLASGRALFKRATLSLEPRQAMLQASAGLMHPPTPDQYQQIADMPLAWPPPTPIPPKAPGAVNGIPGPAAGAVDSGDGNPLLQMAGLSAKMGWYDSTRTGRKATRKGAKPKPGRSLRGAAPFNKKSAAGGGDRNFAIGRELVKVALGALAPTMKPPMPGLPPIGGATANKPVAPSIKPPMPRGQVAPSMLPPMPHGAFAPSMLPPPPQSPGMPPKQVAPSMLPPPPTSPASGPPQQTFGNNEGMPSFGAGAPANWQQPTQPPTGYAAGAPQTPPPGSAGPAVPPTGYTAGVDPATKPAYPPVDESTKPSYPPVDESTKPAYPPTDESAVPTSAGSEYPDELGRPATSGTTSEYPDELGTPQGPAQDFTSKAPASPGAPSDPYSSDPSIKNFQGASINGTPRQQANQQREQQARIAARQFHIDGRNSELAAGTARPSNRYNPATKSMEDVAGTGSPGIHGNYQSIPQLQAQGVGAKPLPTKIAMLKAAKALFNRSAR